mgnify:CR=1 FL=1
MKYKHIATELGLPWLALDIDIKVGEVYVFME